MHRIVRIGRLTGTTDTGEREMLSRVIRLDLGEVGLGRWGWPTDTRGTSRPTPWPWLTAAVLRGGPTHGRTIAG